MNEIPDVKLTGIGQELSKEIPGIPPDVRMDRRKPLPYSAGQLIDEALMNNAEVIRILSAVVEFRFEKEEELRQIVRVITLVNAGSQSLKDIRR